MKLVIEIDLEPFDGNKKVVHDIIAGIAHEIDAYPSTDLRVQMAAIDGTQQRMLYEGSIVGTKPVLRAAVVEGDMGTMHPLNVLNLLSSENPQ